MRYLVLLIAILFSSISTNAEGLDDITDTIFEKKVLEVIRKNPGFIESTMNAYMIKKKKEEEEAKFEALFENKKEIEVGKSPAFGNKKAKYKLVIFTDFQCPYCKRGDDTVKALRKKYGKDLFVVYKNYPLSFHPQAKPAAKAALAAHQQGKFLEYVDSLFTMQKQLAPNIYIEIAKSHNLDLKKFKADMESDKITKLLAQDIADAKKADISSTPNFFVNGVNVAGAYPIEYFEKVIARLK